MEIHNLLPQELRARLPQIGATTEQENPLVLAKFFSPNFHIMRGVTQNGS
jgi:hypothetical protein